MTDKQRRIIDTALDLFTHQGYANTATSQVAREAGVSEGLIFRHFGSKEGLLDAIVAQGLSEVEQLAPRLLEESVPRQVLINAIELPVHLIRNHPRFWKLQSSLKYQQPDMARKYDDSNLLVQLKASVERAFRQLGYANPRAETRLLLIILNGLMTELADEDYIDQDALVNFVKQKYQFK